MSGEVWKLHCEFPVFFVAVPHGEPTPKTVAETPREWIGISLPVFVSSDLPLYFQRHTKEIVAYYKESTGIGVNSPQLITQLGKEFWSGFHTAVRHTHSLL